MGIQLNHLNRMYGNLLKTTDPAKQRETLPARPMHMGDTVHFSGKKPQLPYALKKGDTIALVAPATPLNKDEVDFMEQEIKNKGFKVVRYLSSDWFNTHYLSDTDKNRAEAINKAFANPKVKGVFSIQGGGGTFRKEFLEALDWKTIKKNPKIVTGYSDITFLHYAMRKLGNMISFHSGFPMDIDGLRDNAKAFWEMVAPADPTKPPPPIEAGKKYRCIVPGEVSGELIGGNLSLTSVSMGTPVQPDLKDKILFLEDWRDHYESVDRLFSHLEHNGLWDNVKGIIFGEFWYVPLKKGDYELKWDTFISELTKEAHKRGIPVGYNFPVGHGYNNRPMPLGAKVKFNSTTGTLTFLEPVVKAPQQKGKKK